jgi:NAD(P)-dependent dehydrogenase (short-subunit alcohol dehydrogenase family)
MTSKIDSTETSHRGVAVVTGATGMLGQATARALAASGADVVLVARDQARGARLLADLQRTTSAERHRLVVGDLGSLADVRRMASEIDQAPGGVRALIHTAAALKPTREETAEGHESMFAINVLARFLLTHELRGALKRAAPSRVVMVTGPSPDRLNFEDLMARRRYQPFMQFRATNAANLMLAFSLAQDLRQSAISAYAYHPGILQSDLMKGMPALVRYLTFPFGRTAEPAARALSDLAWSGAHDASSGAFFKLSQPSKPPKASLDGTQQSTLWREAHRLVGLSA